MKKYDFAISYEIINREYECVTLLKKELERRGYSVLVYQATALTKRIKAEVCVLHSFYNNDNFAFVYYVFGKHQKIFNLHWEEIYAKNLMEKDDLPLLPHDYATYVSHLAWGDIEHDMLRKVGVKEENIAKVGAPHLDLIRKDVFLSRDEMAKKYNLDINKKWVLFVSSLVVWDEEEYLNTAGALVMDEMLELNRFSKQSKEIIVDWFNRLSSDSKDIEFIYRPHPEEFANNIEKDFEKALSTGVFHIIDDDVVAQWIYSCDKVYNWKSTAAIQSYLMRKGTTIIRPVRIPENLDYQMFENFPQINTYQQLIDDIDRETEVKRDYLLESYYTMGREYVYKKLADYLEGLYNQPHDYDQIDYSEALKSRSSLLHLRNRLFRNFFVYMSSLCLKYKMLSPFRKIFRLGYRPTEERNIISKYNYKNIEKKIDVFLSKSAEEIRMITDD